MLLTRTLNNLLEKAGVPVLPSGSMEIQGLSYDSRLSNKGDLFFAIQGAHVDGHNYLEEVAKKGVIAAVVDRDVKSSLPLVRVPRVSDAMASLAAEFYQHPSEKITVIGITGTNGKTTTTYLIERALKANKKECGVIGTINYRYKNKIVPAPNTTPMALDIQKFIFECFEQEVPYVAMEVSSHALELGRVNDVRFSVGIFTNLTQDHLDFHKNMENYYKAKSQLFHRKEPVKAVVNIDDQYGKRLSLELKNPLTYGFHPEADLLAQNSESSLNGLSFDLRFPSRKTHKIRSNLLGRHNIYNLLAAAGALWATGFSEEQIVNGLTQPQAVPGRLEPVEAGQDFVVTVDYAHTHDALANVLKTLREANPKQLICVFGAGGDRDKTKRPKMGVVAVSMADFVYVTSDNPRSENPAMIMKDIEAGIKTTGKTSYEMIENREEAISKAIKRARSGDIVLIAGKGHENYQIVGNKKFDFSDVEVARKALLA
jgi:UDP-N-acetylmuramoyl-L-alanyl-D-glutamate--2,6-diaminopimelate ligase